MPQSISPTPIYKQMEKLEEKKREAQNKLAEMQSSGFVKDDPCELQDFQRFLKAVCEILRRDDNLKVRQKVIRYLVHKINILPDGFEVHFKVGESYVKIFLIKLDHGEAQNKKAQALSDSLGLGLDKKNALPDLNSGNASQFLGHFSSNTCLNGARVAGVDEPPLGNLRALIEVEFDEIAEPKALLPADLLQLVKVYGSYLKAADVIGASEAFVRQNCFKRSSS